MPKKTNLDWKTYESITKYIYEALGSKTGVKVLGYGNDCKIPGKSGVSHQIDILTSHSDGIHSYRTAIECKYWKKKINKDTVMKVCEIINDTDIKKGVIVSTKGFTRDGIEFAKYNNIGLIELREISENDQETTSTPLILGELEIKLKIFVNRPIILNTTIEYSKNEHFENESNLNNASIRLADGSQKYFSEYTNSFQKELHSQNKVNEPITKRYEIPGGQLLLYKSEFPIDIKALVFTGILKLIDKSSNQTFSLVDNVWLIMNAIFEEKTFSISENGLIVENKK